MFTGLIQKTGTVKRVSRGAGLVVEIESTPWERPLERGESIAVDGACLTVSDCAGGRFTADVLRETEELAGFGGILPGRKVNLERALRAGDPIGGHLVQGHVERRGRVIETVRCGRDFRMRIECGAAFAARCILKGSVAVDGVSLTVTEKNTSSIAVDIIPTTARETVLGGKKSGDGVNLESDAIGKYAAQALPGAGRGGEGADGELTEEKLRKAGFI